MSFKEQLQEYFKKSGDTELLPGVLVQNDDKGFLVYNLREDNFIILHTYGNGQYWDGYANTLAKESGAKKITFATRRNPKTFERKYNYSLVGYIMEKEVI